MILLFFYPTKEWRMSIILSILTFTRYLMLLNVFMGNQFLWRLPGWQLWSLKCFSLSIEQFGATKLISYRKAGYFRRLLVTVHINSFSHFCYVIQCTNHGTVPVQIYPTCGAVCLWGGKPGWPSSCLGSCWSGTDVECKQTAAPGLWAWMFVWVCSCSPGSWHFWLQGFLPLMHFLNETHFLKEWSSFPLEYCYISQL